MENIPFPFRETDSNTLDAIRNLMIQEIVDTRDLVYQKMRQTQSKIDQLVKLTPNQTLNIEETLEIQNRLVHKIEVERRKLQNMVKSFKLLADISQLTTIPH